MHVGVHSADNLPPTKTSALLIHRLALALAEAHRHHVIHRDLKPANIMIDRKKEPIVMDFGLARQTDAESRMTKSGMIVGTPAFMSPEQIRGKHDEVGPQSDIYALGVILYQLLTGTLPFQGAIAQVVYQIVHEEPKRLADVRSDVDEQLETICAQMMAKERSKRFQSMDEVAVALKEYLKREPSHAEAESVERDSSARAPESTSSDSVSETGALNAFFAAQTSQDAMHTAVDLTVPQENKPIVAATRQPPRGRGPSNRKWLAAASGAFGIVLLASVTIYFADGGRLEVAGDATTKIETDAQGNIASVAVTPGHTSKPSATDGRQAVSANDDGAAGHGWTKLFSGRDLTGWHEVHRDGVWTVDDGAIVSRGRRGNEGPAGWLETDRDFLNFELEFEYYLQRDGNSGVFLRAVPGKTTNGADPA